MNLEGLLAVCVWEGDEEIQVVMVGKGWWKEVNCKGLEECCHVGACQEECGVVCLE